MQLYNDAYFPRELDNVSALCLYSDDVATVRRCPTDKYAADVQQRFRVDAALLSQGAFTASRILHVQWEV